MQEQCGCVCSAAQHLKLSRNILKNGRGAALTAGRLKRRQAISRARRAHIEHAAAKSIEKLGVCGLKVELQRIWRKHSTE